MRGSALGRSAMCASQRMTGSAPCKWGSSCNPSVTMPRRARSSHSRSSSSQQLPARSVQVQAEKGGHERRGQAEAQASEGGVPRGVAEFFDQLQAKVSQEVMEGAQGILLEGMDGLLGGKLDSQKQAMIQLMELRSHILSEVWHGQSLPDNGTAVVQISALRDATCAHPDYTGLTLLAGSSKALEVTFPVRMEEDGPLPPSALLPSLILTDTLSPISHAIPEAHLRAMTSSQLSQLWVGSLTARSCVAGMHLSERGECQARFRS